MSKAAAALQQSRHSLRRQQCIRLINAFYEDKENFLTVYNIINKRKGTKGLSLRLLDFACTAYKASGPYLVKNGEPIYLEDVYRDNLNVYGKANFDCFKRHKRVVLKKHGMTLISTIAQLMFFRNMIKAGVVDYTQKNARRIKRQMAARVAASAALATVNATVFESERGIVPQSIATVDVASVFVKTWTPPPPPLEYLHV